MKILNFTAKEILPALLDKTKDQTIRPAWKEWHKIPNYYGDRTTPLMCNCEENRELKLPRFKVGEEVKLIWNQRSKIKWFCRECGLAVRQETHRSGIGKVYACNKCGWNDEEKEGKVEVELPCIFKKTLSIVEITEVFRIEMNIGNDAPLITGYHLRDTYNLARRDGFKPDNKYVDFYNFFSKYDLSEPKEFYVYRWKYQAGGKK